VKKFKKIKNKSKKIKKKLKQKEVYGPQTETSERQKPPSK
jgi:hypothetical protein